MATIQELIAASLAANPNASHGGYTGVGAGYNPAANPAGNTIQVGGQAPDYNALVQGDPRFQQAQANARAQLASGAAARKAATAKILAQLGIAPDFGSAMSGLGLDQSYLNQDFGGTEKGLASEMTAQGLSTTAQLNKQHETAVGNLADQLAARGSLRSGALGSGLSVENQRDKQAQFDALQQALAQIGQAQGGYNDVVQQSTDNLQQAGDDAVQAQIQLHPAQGGGSIQATYDPDTGLYKTADGAFFNADGSATQVGAANARPVHPANVAPPDTTPAVTPPAGVTPPPVPGPAVNLGNTVGSALHASVPSAVALGNQFSAKPLVSGAGNHVAAVGAAQPGIISLANQSATATPGMPAPNPVPAPAATGWNLTPGAPASSAQQWQNSVSKRLNIPGM